MDEKFEYQGYWWLPGADEDEVPGILKFDSDDGATLDLLGSLKSLKEVIDPLEPEIILGLSSDGKLITLMDCARTLGSLAIGSGFSTSTFAVNTVIVGEHFGLVEDVGFERLVVEYLHLGAWAHASGFDIRFNEELEEPKRRWIEVRHDLPEPFSAAVGDEYEVTLDFGSDFRASHRPFTEVNITQPAEPTIKFPEKQSFGRLSDIIYRLQYLLSLGTGRSGIVGSPSNSGHFLPPARFASQLGTGSNIVQTTARGWSQLHASACVYLRIRGFREYVGSGL